MPMKTKARIQKITAKPFKNNVININRNRKVDVKPTPKRRFSPFNRDIRALEWNMKASNLAHSQRLEKLLRQNQRTYLRWKLRRFYLSRGFFDRRALFKYKNRRIRGARRRRANNVLRSIIFLKKKREQLGLNVKPFKSKVESNSIVHLLERKRKKNQINSTKRA